MAFPDARAVAIGNDLCSALPLLLILSAILSFVPGWFLKRKFRLVPVAVRVIPVILTLYAVYFLALATNPFFEGDAGNILAGAAQMARHVYHPILYNYPVQPLTYEWLVFLIKLTRFDPAIISTLTAQLCLIGTLTIAYCVAHRYRSREFAVAFLAVLLAIHEIIINGSYYNTNIVAMFFLYLAGYLLVLNAGSWIHSIAAGVLVCAAFLFRLDIVLMIPALVLFVWHKKEYRNIVVFLSCFLFLLPVSFQVLRISFSDIRGIANNHFGSLEQYSYPFQNLFLAVPFSIVGLSFFGLCSFCRLRQWMLLVWVLAAVTPLFLFYFRGSTTPKYLLYVYPVFAWLALEGISYLKSYRHRLFGNFLLLFFILFLAWQLIFSGAALYESHIAIKPNNVYSTADGDRTVLGTAFYPLEGFKARMDLQERIRRLIDIEPERNRVYWVHWDYYGVMNYYFTLKAEKIISDPGDNPRGKTYFLSGNVRVRVNEFRFDQSNEKDQNRFRSMVESGYTNIILAPKAIVRQIVGSASNDVDCLVDPKDFAIHIIR